jgi:hypothetical protein
LTVLRRSSRTPWLTDASFGAIIVWMLALLDAATLATRVDVKAIAAGVVVVVWAWHGIRYLRDRRGGVAEPTEGPLDHPRDDDPSRGRSAPH